LKRLKPYILLLPAMVIILGIFASGLIMGFVQSLGHFEAVGLEDFTLKYYKEVLTDRGFLDSLKFTFYISLVSSVVAVILGVVLAYSILVTNHKKGIETLLYKLPIIVPHTVAVILIYNILSQSGFIARVLNFIGVISDQSNFPSLIFDKNGIGIILTYLWKEIPFIAMVVYSVLSNISNKLSDVALNLGANKRQVFRYVLLPLIMPTILSSFIIIFAFSFGAFEVPFLIGPTTPKTLPVKAYIEYTNPDLTNRPYTMVINMILTFFSIVMIWLYNKTFKLINKYNS